MGKSSTNGPFSMAMLNNQRVNSWFIDISSFHGNATCLTVNNMLGHGVQK